MWLNVNAALLICWHHNNNQVYDSQKMVRKNKKRVKISSICVEENALLMSGVRGQNGQTG